MPENTVQADILIVDDIPDNIRFLSNFLLDQGFSVRKAISAQAALKAVKALKPDLILLDINMPEMNGYELCTHLKQHQETSMIPIIFLSAGNEAIDRIKAFQVGAVDYITKPFHLEEVLVRIQTQLTIQILQRELQAQNEQLRQTLEELKVAQANLVQQEKMTALRKVVAGVTHEVNNPLSFIACNIKPAQEYIHQLLALIELYQRHSPNPSPDISALLEEMDLKFLAEDLLNILHSMAKGAERIRTVILALKIFTRLDESGIKQVNLHESIDSVLEILHHRLESRLDAALIQVVKNYSQLPLITCHAEQINQVFFNLICNAIDAIDEKLKTNPITSYAPLITLTTQAREEGRVMICIQDNGIGIGNDLRERIFEPFFTTKSAGQGIGLGLATCRRIIQEVHQGQLTCDSTIGEGSTFQVYLPIHTDGF
ncbi:MAG: response regulator [Leptolyngbyaceae cyanobacterium bins.59]|nr:response regulator [Leptolyngbyaceae cyanobacterium bins.59]